MFNEKGRSGVHVNIISSVFFNKKFKKRALGPEKCAFGRKKRAFGRRNMHLGEKSVHSGGKSVHSGEKSVHLNWANNSKLYFQNVHLEVTFI